MLKFFSRVAALIAVLAFATMLAGTASAHSALTGASPESGSSVDVAPERVTLTFNENLQEAFATVRVVGPDKKFWETSKPVIDGRSASVSLNGLGPAGVYEVNYRVTSADGHPVSGQTTFTLSKPGTGTPGEAVPADYVAPEESGDGVKAWPFIVGGAAGVLLIAGVVAAMLLKRRR